MRCFSCPAGVRTIQKGVKSPSKEKGEPRPMVIMRGVRRSGVVDGSGWRRLLMCEGDGSTTGYSRHKSQVAAAAHAYLRGSGKADGMGWRRHFSELQMGA
jgi:hypothetical protein